MKSHSRKVGMWILVAYSCKKCFIKVKKNNWALQKLCQKGALKVTICWKNQIDQINIFTFKDDLVVDVGAKMWILVSYSCKKCFIKVKKKSLSSVKAFARKIHKIWPFVKKNQVDQINILTFMDDLVVDGMEKMWILFSYSCK